VTTTPLAQGAGAATMIVDIQKPKRKRKYARGLKDAQRLERGVAKASRRVASGARSRPASTPTSSAGIARRTNGATEQFAMR